MLFRDHWLSDLIGFQYQHMRAGDAAAHFLAQIRAQRGRPRSAGPDYSRRRKCVGMV